VFKNKILLITGGTGSFGNAVLRRFLDTDINEIRIFSRDEKKQDDMRKKYNNSKLKFYIGDVRDVNSITDAMRGVDYVFHAAALKQVPSCEFYPMQAVQTNVIGTENVLNCAINAKVKKVIVLSTDKAVYPINAMGVSKAMMEKVAVAKSRNLTDSDTMIACTRYGNVMASRGSVIPLFIDQIKRGKEITITDPAMTRFMMTLEQAVELVLFAFENGKNGDIFVQKAPAASIGLLAQALTNLLGRPEHEIRIIGTRHGEKLYEALLTREEMVSAEDMQGYYRIPADTRDLNYSKYFEVGEEVVTQAHEYHSHNTQQLTLEELQSLLLGLREIQNDLKKLNIQKGNERD
jgi:UDP-glucose 4-epimerase